MSRNRLKPANSLPSRKIWVWVVCFGVLTVGGLFYLHLHIKNNTLAKDCATLDTALKKEAQNNLRRDSERGQLRSAKMLKKQLAHYRIDMVELNQLQVLDAQSFQASMLARRPDRRAWP
ncbi:MAG: hypothetical protein LBK60_10990 [Verrucomicrobiales bacterium]|jgi:hypothetical protein|nr:hypothetical protein [Verrucomicrobiales bacterium]